jgi:PST family polysaccharide transporter
LKIGIVIAAFMIVGCMIALPYGPKGVAFAYSGVMTLLSIPLILWSVHDTPISRRDIMSAVSRPLASGVVAGALAFGARLLCGPPNFPLIRLVVESGVLLVVFFGFLLFVTGQKSLYLDLLTGWRRPSTGAESVSA